MKKYYYRIKYRREYKALKFQIAINNEKVQMATEIQQHGRILLKGITV